MYRLRPVNPSFHCLLRVGFGLVLAGVIGLPAWAGEIHDAVLAHDLRRVRQLLLEKP